MIREGINAKASVADRVPANRTQRAFLSGNQGLQALRTMRLERALVDRGRPHSSVPGFVSSHSFWVGGHQL